MEPEKYYRVEFAYCEKPKVLKITSDKQLAGFISSLDLSNTKDLRIWCVTEQELHFEVDPEDGTLRASFLE